MSTASRPVLALALVLAGTTAVLTLAMSATRSDDRVAAVVIAIVLTVTASTGALVAFRRPAHPCGWLMAGAALSMAVPTAATDYVQASVAADRRLPATSAIGWLATWPAAITFGLAVLLVLTFPSGSFTSHRWRVIGRAVIVLSAVNAIALALTPGPLPVAAAVSNPLGVHGGDPVLRVVASVTSAVVAVVGIAAIAMLIFRSRRAEGLEREQLRLVGRALAIAALGLAFAMVVSGPLNELSFFVAAASLCTVPVAIGWAVLRHGLFDIEALVNRTLVYGVLTLLVAALYVAVVVITGSLIGSSDLRVSLFGVAVVAVVFGPVHQALQRLVDRRMYGDRGVPYEVLTRLTSRFEDAAGPEHLLPLAIAEIGESLRLRSVVVDLRDGEELVTAYRWGDATARPTQRFELVHAGEPVGQLMVSARADEQLRPRDSELLEALSAPIATAIHSNRMNAELRASQQALVTVMEEERRRLRADLHDGLGPELAGIGMTIAAARLELQRDVETADALLRRVQEHLRGTVTQVRLLVDGMAPAVDQLGLVGALRQGADRLSGADAVRFTVDASPLPHLPAAVEVAAYRIAMEAMTNVVRHADARHCVVRLGTRDARLTVEVADDGTGLPPTVGSGVGLTSIRRRAQELGGLCSIGPAVGGGTLVVAELPL